MTNFKFCKCISVQKIKKMILEIYKTMLDTVLSTKAPKYVELVYHIDENESENFWADENLKHEHKLLLEEWEHQGNSKYTKIFYGTRFSIKFNYKN